MSLPRDSLDGGSRPSEAVPGAHVSESRTKIFMPSPGALNWVVAIGMGSLGYAIYLRYLVIEQSTVGLACDSGLNTWLCLTRKVTIGLFEHEVFGAVAHLARPCSP